MRSVAPVVAFLALAQAQSSSTSTSSWSTPTSWSSTTFSTWSSTTDSSTSTTTSSTTESSTTSATESTTTTSSSSSASSSPAAKPSKWPLPPEYPSYPIPPEEVDFSCVKTQHEYTNLVPRCTQYCHQKGLLSDGCARNDHICHCKNFAKVGAVIEPCLFGDDPGPWGPCSDEDIGALVQFAGHYCGFWNATAAKATEYALSVCHKKPEGEEEGQDSKDGENGDDEDEGPGAGKGKGKGKFARFL